MNRIIPEVLAPVAGVAAGMAVGYGVAELIDRDVDYDAERQSAIEACQYTLEDTAQQVSDLPSSCEAFAPFFAYNYAQGNYYVPAANELADFVPTAEVVYEENIEDDRDMDSIILTSFGLLGLFGGAVVSVQARSKRYEERYEEKFRTS